MKERVQKLMAQANFGSRRVCEEIIRQGRVRVNGEVIELGSKADPGVDEIVVDGVRLSAVNQAHIYLALNKPLNVLSTSAAHKSDRRQTVFDLIPFKDHLFMVGRLDAESEGLMVLTNDGDLTNRLTHPRYQHTKTYRVEVHGLPSAETIAQWQGGVELEDGMTAACSVRITHADNKVTTLRVVMIEGKKRQIRRVASQLGHPVKRLQRTHIGKLELGKLRPGEWMELTEKDIQAMLTPADEFQQLKRERLEASRSRRWGKGGKPDYRKRGPKTFKNKKGKT